MQKKVVILGSTGSVGKQTLAVIEQERSKFEVLAIGAGANARGLLAQAKAYAPNYVGIADEAEQNVLQEGLPPATTLIAGADAMCTLASLDEADVIVIGISGIAGLPPLLEALRAGKTVAIANKESIVCAYPLVKAMIDAYGGRILPVDSEHSALFQCLQNGRREEVAVLHLTASGGRFWEQPDEVLAKVTPQEALFHPVWNMGKKITIDSATLFNKGLELIEAAYLYEMPNSHISVLIHPQSIVHSMVEYTDGAVIAQLAMPDMRLPIQYALSYPERLNRQIPRLSLHDIGKLTFYDGNRQPAIVLARQALIGGGALPTVYHAANDIAVQLFLEGRIGFLDIRRAVEYALEHAPKANTPSTLEDVLAVDKAARRIVRERYSRKREDEEA